MKIEKYLCDVCNNEFSIKDDVPYRLMIYRGNNPLIFNEVCKKCTDRTIGELIKIKEDYDTGNAGN